MGVNDYIQIGNRIKALRKEKGISQKYMAKKILGIPVSTYSGYENNYREPNSEMLEKIADALGVSVSDLVINISFETPSKESLDDWYRRNSTKENDPQFHFMGILFTMGYSIVDDDPSLDPCLMTPHGDYRINRMALSSFIQSLIPYIKFNLEELIKNSRDYKKLPEED